MTKPRDRRKHTGRKVAGNFLMIPADVLDSANFCSLTAKSKALLLDIGAKYNGYNNGNLAAPWSWMRNRGWKSKDTLQRAITELLHSGIIELTRQGGLIGPSLYAFTWLPINESRVQMDVASTNVASGRWKLPATPNQKTEFPPRLSGKGPPTIGVVKKKAA
jgi:hypothetical protein